MADGRIVRVADARLSGIFRALINATQAPNPGYIWLLMWMPGVSALLTRRILRGPLSASAGRIAGDLDQRHRRLPRLRLGASSRRLFTKWMQAIWASGSSSLPRSWRWCSG